MEFGYKENGSLRVTLTSPRLLARYALTLYSTAQIGILIVVAATGRYPQLVTETSFGYLLFILWFNRAVLRKVLVVLHVIREICPLLVVLAVVVLVFAAFGDYIFALQQPHDDDDFNQSQFSTYGEAVWAVFTAVAGWSFPNQILPGYRWDRAYFFYFFAFITLGSFGVRNLIIATVLVEYNTAEQMQADQAKAKRQILLLRAFQVLCGAVMFTLTITLKADPNCP